jgi:hypothetical protein
MSREKSRIAWDSTWESLAADTRAMYARERMKFGISVTSDTQRVSIPCGETLAHGATIIQFLRESA